MDSFLRDLASPTSLWAVVLVNIVSAFIAVAITWLARRFAPLLPRWLRTKSDIHASRFQAQVAELVAQPAMLAFYIAKENRCRSEVLLFLVLGIFFWQGTVASVASSPLLFLSSMAFSVLFSVVAVCLTLRAVYMTEVLRVAERLIRRDLIEPASLSQSDHAGLAVVEKSLP